MSVYKHNVLFQDGYFRIVEPTEYGHSSMSGVFIQHQHTTPVPKREETRGTQGCWVYCWHETQACKLCETKVPEKMIGFLNLIGWNNESN